MDDSVIVVGGGLAGLAAAATAARAGAPVTVLEAGAELGGRARTTVTADGHRLNLGPHALYGGGAAERVLRALGAWPTGGAPRVARHAVLAGDALRPAPYAPRGLSPRLLAALTGVVTGRATAPARTEGRSAAAWLDASFGPRVRPAVTMLTRVATYCADLDALPAAVAAEQLRRSVRPGVRYLDGGWAPMAAALAGRATGAGAQVRPGARVAALVPGGVRLRDGSEVRGRAVVLAGLTPAQVARLVVPAGGRAPLAGDARPVRAACLDVALARLPRRSPTAVFGRDAPLYLSVHSASADVAPPGGAVVHVARYLVDDGPAPDRGELEALLDRAQPGWREHVVHARFLPRIAVVAHAGPRAAAGATGLPGVLLAGDWVGDEGWLADAALASGAAAGARAARDVLGRGAVDVDPPVAVAVA